MDLPAFLTALKSTLPVISQGTEKLVNCNSYSLMSPPVWLQIKGQGIRSFLVKLGGRFARIKNKSGWRITVFHERSSLKELEHLSCKETKDRSSITPVWALIPAAVMSRTVSDKRSAKGSDVGRALVIQRVVIFPLQQCWVDTSAKHSEHGAFSRSVWGVHRGCCDPWSSDCFQQLRALFQDPNNDVWNNILPNLLPPLI